MNLTAAFTESLEGLPGFDRERFEAVHAAGSTVTSVRLNRGKLSVAGGGEGIAGIERRVLAGLTDGGAERVPWSSQGYYLPRRPSFTMDPRFHGGAYYVQEASSMFLEQALRYGADLSRPVKVLDLCAAPGGKSTLLQSLLPVGSLLVSNDVIRNRVHILEENIVKWGAPNMVLTSSDPTDFGKLENYFDVIVVDAPCSGSGLIRREPAAMSEWSPDAVKLCSRRQQRILADCWPALRQEGVLIYSTCSYSREEDEDIAEWVTRKLGAESIRLPLAADSGIVETAGDPGGYGYRFYPDKLRGEGLYITCFRKRGGGAYVPGRKKDGIARLTKKEEAAISGRVSMETAFAFFDHAGLVHAVPADIFYELPTLRSVLRLVRAGVPLGRLAAKEFIPAHDLALSVIAARELPAVELSREDAIRYLKKDEMPHPVPQLGWMLVRYDGFNLGWIKALRGRVNNYYPKEWRILRREP